MTTLLEDRNLGTADDPFWCSPHYRGHLTKRERRRMIANSAAFVRDVLRYDAAGNPHCTSTD